MARAEIPIGRGTYRRYSAGGSYIRQLSWGQSSDSVSVIGQLVASGLLADPTTQTYLALLITSEYEGRVSGNPPGHYMTFRTTDDSTETGDGYDTGPSLSDAWEEYEVAIKIVAGSFEWEIAGPNAASVLSADTAEPYSWRTGASGSSVRAKISAYNSLSTADRDATKLILDDGRGAYARGSIETGVPVLRGRAVAGRIPLYACGSIETGAPRLQGRVLSEPPPEYYCLDPDNASTTGILTRKENGIKLFLELTRSLIGLSETLPDGKTARPLIKEIPEIRIDDSFFEGAGDVTLSLDNRRGDFNEDQIGRYVQIWSLSYGSEKRPLFIGRVSSQVSSPLEATLVASDLPVESLRKEIPGRNVDQVLFPDSRVPGVAVPVVFGRAIRMRCPHLGSGLSTVLRNAAGSGDTEISLFSVLAIAPGDVLFLSVGEVQAEKVVVESVNIYEVSVTLTAGITNSHPEEASVTAAGIIEDYLLGEGEWSGGNFSKVFRVYHNERALPEFVCPEAHPPKNLVAGDNDFELDQRHRVQFEGWYRNYFIEFIDAGGNIVGSSVVTAYNPGDNTVEINLTNAVANYTCYRLREYRFFDGSQDAPHGGYAFLRLARRYQGEIHADVKGFDETSPSEVLKECLKNSTWGAGETLDIEIENDIQNYDFEGAINSRQSLGSLVTEMGKFRPLRIVRERDQLTIRWQSDEVAVLMPPTEDKYVSAPSLRRLPLEQRRKSIAVRYRLDLRENEASQEILEIPGGEGAESEITLPFVYDRETADRVAYGEGQRELSLRSQVELGVNPRDLAKDIALGSKIRIPAGLLDGQDTDWIVTAINSSVDKALSVTARAYRSGLFTYPVDRLALSAEDTYDPPVDFSETPPEPLRNFRAMTVSTMQGGNTFFECVVEFTRPKENYSTAEIWFALGGSKAVKRTEEDPGFPGTARFPLPLELTRYKVVGYSVSKSGRLRGYPVSFSVNETPIADAGGDRTVNAGARVVLDGSGSSDPDNDQLSYLWEQLSGTIVSITNPTSEQASFNAPNTSDSHVLEFQLTVSDGESSSTDSVTVNVNAYVPPPVYAPSPALSYYDNDGDTGFTWMTDYPVDRMTYRYRNSLNAGTVLFFTDIYDPPVQRLDRASSFTFAWYEFKVRRASDGRWSRYVSVIPPG